MTPFPAPAVPARAAGPARQRALADVAADVAADVTVVRRVLADQRRGALRAVELLADQHETLEALAPHVVRHPDPAVRLGYVEAVLRAREARDSAREAQKALFAVLGR